MPNSKPRCVLSQLHIAFCLNCTLRFVSRHVALCLKTCCVLSQDSLCFISRLVAFCLKARCVLSQDSLRFVSKLVAFCLKARCVLSQDSLRFVSRFISFCPKIRCVLHQDSLCFVSGIVAFCLLRFVNRSSLRLAIPLQINFSWSRPNGKMIVDSIENRPYVRGMIATPGEPDLPVCVPESFHEETDEELTDNDLKRMDADDQAIQTILLGLSEDIYAAVDSFETAKKYGNVFDK
nr:hypothetical protein [Tanacetum cinerariifolium]